MTNARPIAIETIPSHWDVLRAKTIFKSIDERSKEGTEELLSVSHLTGVTPRSEKNVTMFMAESYAGYKLCYPGDLVINSIWAWMSALGFSEYHGIISTVYSVYRLRNPAVFNYRYLDFLLRSELYACEYLVRSKGVWTSRLLLSDDAFFNIPIIVPPRREQDAIVAFLDEKLANIDRYIAAKQRLIDLLNEQKAAIINRAVTRGLDETVEMKESGVEWSGEVPAHWEATRLKFVAQVQTGLTLGKNYGGKKLETRPYLRVANVQTGYLNLLDVATLDLPSDEALKNELRLGDVLMTEGGDPDKLGRGCIWQGEIENCLHQNHIFAVRPDKGLLLPEYLVKLMASDHGRTYFQITAKQTTNLASTNSTTLRAFPLFLPDIGEQKMILNSLSQELADFDLAMENANREIELMQELRTTLIAEAVTGKLNVWKEGAPNGQTG